jgi:hypothetical protein
MRQKFAAAIFAVILACLSAGAAFGGEITTPEPEPDPEPDDGGGDDDEELAIHDTHYTPTDR